MDEGSSTIVWAILWTSSLFFGSITLMTFWKDRISCLAGFYALKPSVLVIVQTIILSVAHKFVYGYSYLRINGWTNVDSILEGFVSISTELIVTLLVVYLFWDIYKSNREIALVLLVVDFFRWFGFVVFEELNNFQLPYYYYVSKLITYFFFQACFALLLGFVRNKKNLPSSSW